MKISLDWLQDFVTWQGTPEELADGLTCLGLNVEGVDEYTQNFPGVVVAKVLTTNPHPNADRLSLCTVHDGEQELAVVCGAPNVREGLHVLLARPGAVLPGGLKIAKTKIRGTESLGMICSARELALGADAAGIIELSEENAPGLPADALYGYRDVVFDIEVTPNRPDWLSHLGVAREVAALGGTKVTSPPVWKARKSRGQKLDMVVDIEDFADCPRYTAHAAREVRVGPAPAFMQNRLRAIGARPINNIVDISNYVMFELGQPLHAFDRSKLNGNKLFVRRSAPDEGIVSLDEVERKLGSDYLVIADAAGPVAIAGVMGGVNSEVDTDTQEVLLESAFFDPTLIRKGSRTLGLISESSYRFEREADWEMVPLAAHRALYLLQQHAGASIVSDWVDRQNPDRVERPSIPLRIAQVNRLLGTELEATDATDLLQKLSLKVVPLGGASDRKRLAANLMVEVPSFRRDLALEVDLMEEIARLHGYDKIGRSGKFRGGSGGSWPPDVKAQRRIRRHLASCGYHEIATSSFFGHADLESLKLPVTDKRAQFLTISNPHHGGQTLLRTSVLPALLGAIRRNINANNALPLRLFQIGKVFLPAGDKRSDVRHEEEKLLPEEPLLLQIGLAALQEEGLGGVPADLLEIKGVIEAVSQLLRIPLRAIPEDQEPYLTPGRHWRLLTADDVPVGAMGAVATEVLAAHEIELPVAVAELELSRLSFTPVHMTCQRFGRFPAVKRDLSLLVPDGITFAEVSGVVGKSGGELLASLKLFDIYRGSELPDSTAAVGIRLKFRSDEGNLKGKVVDKTIAKIEKALAKELNVHLRG